MGAADERTRTNSHDDAERLTFTTSKTLTYKDNVVGGGNRSTEYSSRTEQERPKIRPRQQPLSHWGLLRTNDNEQPRRCRTSYLNYYSNYNEQRQRRRRWRPLDGVLRSADSVDEPLEGGATGRSTSGSRRRAAGGGSRKTTGFMRISEGGRRKPSTREIRISFLGPVRTLGDC